MTAARGAAAVLLAVAWMVGVVVLCAVASGVREGRRWPREAE